MGEQGDSSKKDFGKARYDLVPPEPLEALAELYGIGAAKYADRDWESGMKWGRVFAAMMRHAWRWWRGEKYDPVDGQHHLSSVAWCAFSLYAYELRKVGEDNRAKQPVPLSPRIAESLNAIDRRTPACPDLDQELPEWRKAEIAQQAAFGRSDLGHSFDVVGPSAKRRHWPDGEMPIGTKGQ